MALSCKAGLVLGLALGATPTWTQAPAAPGPMVAPAGLLAPARAKRVLQQARARLYRLWGAGMGELRCQVAPDWDAFYEQVPANSVDRTRLLFLLRPVRFNVLIARDVSVTLTHQPDAAATASADMVADVRAAISGMEQSISGFLATWTFLSVDTPLPNDQIPYQIEPLPAQFRVTYADENNAVRVEAMLSTEFTVEQLTSTMPALTTIIRPTWTTSTSGLLLSGYEGEAIFTKSPVPRHALVTIETQTVDGLQLPSIVRTTTTSNDSTETLLFTFVGCHNSR